MLNGHATICGLIEERSKTHGDYGDNASVAQQLKAALRSRGDWDSLTETQRESLDLICSKMGRIVSGDASFDDHWNDIAGYALLPLRFR